MSVRHPIALTAALSSIVLAWCACAFALDPSLDISQYAHTVWKIRDGFTKGSIYAIAQTPDGYLWLGTEFGLQRFDGVRVIPWQPPPDQQLPSSFITSLIVARDGALWIGTFKGLASWKGGKLSHYVELAGQTVSGLLEDHEGSVWVSILGIPSGRLCAIHKGSVQCYGGDGKLGQGPFGLYEDSKGNLWAGVPYGLWRWKPGPPRFYPVSDLRDGIQGFSEGDDGALLIGTRSGIRRLVDGKIEAYPLPGAVPKFDARKLLRDRDGSLWIGTHDAGVLHVHQGRIDVFAQTKNLSGDDILAIFEDREGNIWIATTNGLDRFRDFAISTFSVNQGLSNAIVASVLADKDGGIWVGTYSGLNRWSKGQITIPLTGSVKRDGKLSGLMADSLFQDGRGRLWVSTRRGFGYLENNQFVSVTGIPGGPVHGIGEDASGNLWIANQDHGLFRLSPRSQAQRIPWSELEHEDYAWSLAADPSGDGVWLGFYQGGIINFRDGHVRASYTATDGLGEGPVNGFRFDPGGTVWVATEGGLSRLKAGHIVTLTTKSGLPCDSVHWVMEDNDHWFWLYMACGLVRIADSDVDAWAAAADKDKDTKWMIQTTVFDNSEGVRGHATATGYVPHVTKSSDGRLWFATIDGISVVDPRHLPFNNVPPPVRIEQVLADGKSQDLTHEVRLPAHVRDVAINYTALSLVAPEKIHFRYKLEGQDLNWREVVNDRQVQYSNLSPKHYRFRLIASNNSGVWNEEGATLDFVIPPVWYQTNWFRALCFVAFLAFLWAIYQLRVQQLRRQFAIRVIERTRIARELHDTVLQTIQGSMLVADDALVDLTDPVRTRRSLQRLSDWLKRATKEGRAAIHGLQTSTTERNDLAEALCRAVENCQSETPMEVHFVVTGDARDMHPIVRDEVYQIGCEAIRNAFVHSGGTRLDVGLNYLRDLSVRVHDNGVGIDSTTIEKGRSGHFGLQGMRERAARIGGKLIMVSSPHSGTDVTLLVPGRIVFRNTIQRSIEKIRRRLDGLS
jgi:ligand-binding sensor domain-containing protein/signal transduction histidine kinase